MLHMIHPVHDCSKINEDFLCKKIKINEDCIFLLLDNCFTMKNLLSTTLQAPLEIMHQFGPLKKRA
jgi:hypothetical protein